MARLILKGHRCEVEIFAPSENDAADEECYSAVCVESNTLLGQYDTLDDAVEYSVPHADGES